MAKFSEVFSTTFKVIAALVLISLAAGAIYLMVHSAASGDSSRVRETLDDVNKEQEQRNTAAEAKHTSMPLSKWNKLVAAAIKQHCAFEGMHKNDVEKALGKPAETSLNYDKTETWTYASEDQKKCVKYDGEKCVEHPTTKNIVFLTPGGYVYLGNTGPGCYDESFFSLQQSIH
jgi:hypothetical protein